MAATVKSMLAVRMKMRKDTKADAVTVTSIVIVTEMATAIAAVQNE